MYVYIYIHMYLYIHMCSTISIVTFPSSTVTLEQIKGSETAWLTFSDLVGFDELGQVRVFFVFRVAVLTSTKHNHKPPVFVCMYACESDFFV